MKLTTAFSSAYENQTLESSCGYLVLSKQAGNGLEPVLSAPFSASHSFGQSLYLKAHNIRRFVAGFLCVLPEQVNKVPEFSVFPASIGHPHRPTVATHRRNVEIGIQQSNGCRVAGTTFKLNSGNVRWLNRISSFNRHAVPSERLI
jgi:hypothetical protein